ncbi:MAG: uroporphyrinogen-III synthase [Candidatus Hydrothermarchaeales archaeon]
MRVAITRPKERSEETIKLVRNRGWEAIIVSAIEIIPRVKEEILKGVGKLEDYDWLVLTSAFGADIMLEYFGSKLGQVGIAVIGPKTKDALETAGIKVELIPKEYEAEALARELAERAKGKKILVARAAIGREVLVEELRKVAQVVEVPLYDTEMPKDASGIEEFAMALDAGEIDAVIFTSSQTASNLFEVLGGEFSRKLSKVKVCAIGPKTAETLQGFGVEVDITPNEYTVGACLDALQGEMR